MDEMNASFGIGVNLVPDQYGNYIGAGGGNTSLEPKEALGIDLTYENYFAEDGYFSIALYHKDLKEWIFDGAAVIDVSDFLAASGQSTPDGSTTATVNGKVNGGDGTLTRSNSPKMGVTHPRANTPKRVTIYFSKISRCSFAFNFNL